MKRRRMTNVCGTLLCVAMITLLQTVDWAQLNINCEECEILNTVTTECDPRVDLDIYRLGSATTVAEDIDDKEGSITKVLNPNEGEILPPASSPNLTWALKIEPNINISGLPSGNVFTFKFRKTVISAADDPQIKVYRDNTVIMDVSDTESTLQNMTDLSADFRVEFIGGGICDLKLVAFKNGNEWCSDSVRMSGIACPPKSGHIIYVNPGSTAPAAPYNDFVNTAAHDIATAVSASADNDNVVVSAGTSYSLSTSLTVDKSIVLGGLGLRWIDNTFVPSPLQNNWKDTYSPKRPDYSLLPTLKQTAIGRLILISVVGASDVSLGGFIVQDGNLDDPLERGAGVKATGKTVRMYAVKFLNNSSLGVGGALTYAGDTLLDVADCEFEQNKSHLGGAGIFLWYTANGTVNIRRDLFKENITTFGNTEPYPGLGRPGGGGIQAHDSTATIEISDCLFHMNSISQEETTLDTFGYLRGAYGGACDFDGGNPDVSIHQVDFVQNKAASTINRAAGGAVSVRGVDMARLDSVEVSKCQFSGNVAGLDDGEQSRGTGGGIYLSFGDLVVKKCSFKGNRVWSFPPTNLPRPLTAPFAASHIPDFTCYGGGIAAYRDVTVDISDTCFEVNFSKNCAGAVGVVGKTEAITGEVSATTDPENQTFTINNSRFFYNQSEYHGGAFTAASANTGGEITTCTFKNNVNVSFNQSQLCVPPQQERKKDSTIDSDFPTIDSDGGAISYQATSPAVSLHITDTLFDSNRASGDGGACKFGGGSHTVFSNSKLINNSTYDDGGAVRVSTGGIVTFLDCTLTDNKAGYDGQLQDHWCSDIGHGGALALENSKATLQRCVVSGNRAGKPASLKLRNGGAFYVTTGYIGNAATTPFGADPVAQLIVRESIVSANEATSFGGVLFAQADYDDMDLKFETSTFSANFGGQAVTLGPPQSIVGDTVAGDPAYSTIYGTDLLNSNNRIDGFYVERLDSGILGSVGEPVVTFKLGGSSVTQKSGSDGIAVYMMAEDNHEDLQATFMNTTFDGFAVGVVSRAADITLMQNCAFNYSVQVPTKVTDMMILNSSNVNDPNNQNVLIKNTLFDAHGNATGIMAATTDIYGTGGTAGLNITVSDSHFNGRTVSGPVPPVANRGGIVVLNDAGGSLTASQNWWDDANGPFCINNATGVSTASFASRFVTFGSPLNAAPSSLGPIGTVGAPATTTGAGTTGTTVTCY